MNTTSINKVLAGERQFIGTFPKDQLPAYTTKPCGLVINTDNADKPGEHWVAVYIDEQNNAEYFDSFGLPPLHAEIIAFLDRESPARWTYNNITLQAPLPTSLVCGIYCILFLKFRFHGFTYIDFLSLFTKNVFVNELIMSLYLKLE